MTGLQPVRLLPQVWLVGSGAAGFGLTHALDCHVYFVAGTTGWAVIDAGSGVDSDTIVANVRAAAIEAGCDLGLPGVLLLTHAHADHSGGAADLAAAFPGLKVFAGTDCVDWIREGDKLGVSLDRGIASGVYPADFQYRGCPGAAELRGGAMIKLGGSSIEVVDAPGHAAGHLCFVLHMTGGGTVLFSGDCVFANGWVSIQNLHDVSIQSYAATLAHLAELDFDALLPGHHAVSLSDGPSHIAAAADEFASGRVPGNAP